MMNLPLFGIVLFAVAFLIHLILWKFYLPKNHTKILVFIFLTVWVPGIFIYYRKFSNLESISFYCAMSECIQLSFLYFSIALAYITTYSALEVDSPSLVMVSEIARAGVKGLDREIFERRVNDDLLVMPRINDLIKDKMVYREKELLKLSSKGWLVVKLFIIYRNIIRYGKGG